jgi:peptidoglycan/LPS O-acetylase OafA/YrhL
MTRIATVWSIVFAVVHLYWAAGGEFGSNGAPADTTGEQLYIAFIAAIGLVAAVVAHRGHVRLARIGAAALLVGVAAGTTRWLTQGDLGDDGAGGVIITLYFLLGGMLFLRLGLRRREVAC